MPALLMKIFDRKSTFSNLSSFLAPPHLDITFCDIMIVFSSSLVIRNIKSSGNLSAFLLTCLFHIHIIFISI